MQSFTLCTDLHSAVEHNFPTGKVLELQAQDEASAQEWRTAINEARAGAGEVAAEEVAKLQSLAHYAPRKGTLVLGRKGSRSSMAVASLTSTSTSPSRSSAGAVSASASASAPAFAPTSTAADVSQWTPQQVADWVGSFGREYAQYNDNIVDNGINGEALLDEFGEDELDDLKVEKKSHRKRILREAKKLQAM